MKACDMFDLIIIDLAPDLFGCKVQIDLQLAHWRSSQMRPCHLTLVSALHIAS